MELHNRQFIAGPLSVERENLVGRESFASLRIGFHPGLPVAKGEGADRELVALGHLIDPSLPAFENEDVLQSLLVCTTFDQLEGAMAELGGRWLLFARIGDATRLYPDAGGSKSAFYSDGWVASQPGLFGHPVDNGLSAYPYACTWPMGETPFEGVRQLLPNHYLDLKTFHAVRFGPRPVVNVQIDEAVRTISGILRGTLEALIHRGSVALPLTGGRDSRTILSAGFDIRSRFKLFTIVDEETPRHDYVVPQMLANIARQPLQFIRGVAGRDVGANTSGLWQDRYQHRLPGFAQADFVVLGHLSEIFRCCYWTDGIPRHVTPELLSSIAGFEGMRQETFARWLENAPSMRGVDFLDLFYWESRGGLWSSLCCSVLDSYCDVISPYNCRRLIETGLGVDVAFRRKHWELHRRLCRPELLSVPFNETRFKGIDGYLAGRVPWRVRMLARRLEFSMFTFVMSGLQSPVGADDLLKDVGRLGGPETK